MKGDSVSRQGKKGTTMFLITQNARRVFTATLMTALLATSLAGCQMQTTGAVVNAPTTERVAKVTEVPLATDVSLYTIKANNGCRVTTNNVVVGRNPDGSIESVAMTSDIRANQVCGLAGEVVHDIPGVASALLTIRALNAAR